MSVLYREIGKILTKIKIVETKKRIRCRSRHLPETRRLIRKRMKERKE